MAGSKEHKRSSEVTSRPSRTGNNRHNQVYTDHKNYETKMNSSFKFSFVHFAFIQIWTEFSFVANQECLQQFFLRACTNLKQNFCIRDNSQNVLIFCCRARQFKKQRWNIVDMNQNWRFFLWHLDTLKENRTLICISKWIYEISHKSDIYKWSIRFIWFQFQINVFKRTELFLRFRRISETISKQSWKFID